jgi:hypothetical protein
MSQDNFSYIPVLRNTKNKNKSVVFTTKWDGVTLNNFSGWSQVWLCDNKDVALMRAIDYLNNNPSNYLLPDFIKVPSPAGDFENPCNVYDNVFQIVKNAF